MSTTVLRQREFLCRACMTIHRTTQESGRLPHYCQPCRTVRVRVQVTMSADKQFIQSLQPVYDRWRWQEKQGPTTKEQFLIEVFEMTEAVQRARDFIRELRNGK